MPAPFPRIVTLVWVEQELGGRSKYCERPAVRSETLPDATLSLPAKCNPVAYTGLMKYLVYETRFQSAHVVHLGTSL